MKNRPVVMSKDGIYIRGEGLVARDYSTPGFSVKPSSINKQKNEEEDGRIVSRFNCVHKPKDK